MRSNGPSAASFARIASTIAAAVAAGLHSPPSVASKIARSIPIAIASRSWSAASSDPSARTVVVPPPASTIRTASSTAHSSCGLTVKARNFVSIARSSGVSVILPAVAGTRLTQTRMFIGVGSPSSGSCAHPDVLRVEQRRRAHDVDRDGVALAEVLDLELVARDRLVGWQVREQDVLPDRWTRPGARHERAAALGIGDRSAIGGQDRLAAEHVALLAGRRGRIVDGERAEGRDRRVLTLPEVRLTTDEGHLLDPRALHVRLDEVELELELVAVRPIALLEPPGRAVDADPERDDAMRAAGLPERVPEALALLHRHV